MCFDTLETLFFLPAPPEALVNVGSQTAGIEMVLDWMRYVLPRLRHTLVLMSGRPVPDNRLARELADLGLMDAGPEHLAPFNSFAEIRAYLEAYGCPVDERELTAIQQITEGRPLLLTCYAETRRAQDTMPAGLPYLPALDMCASRPEFEDWIVGTFLNPMAAHDTVPGRTRQETLAYCLYFLVYARRGIPRRELYTLFETIGLPYGPGSYDREMIEQLDQVALVKNIGDLLFLHDEIFVMIDQSDQPDACGLREPTLSHLCQMSRQMVQRADQSTLLGSMADNMYYELTHDFEGGYRAYMVYVDRLLFDRNANAALILSDAFWRTLNYRVEHDGDERLPYRDALSQAPMISEEQIRRDEQVRQVRLLRAREQTRDAMQHADALFRTFVEQGIIPHEENVLAQDLGGKDLYLFVSLSLSRAIAITQVRPLDFEHDAERLYAGVIEMLESAAAEGDDLLALRRWYFLGQVYTLRGYLRRLQQRFEDARTDAERGWASFKKYRQRSEDGPSPEELLNDNTVAEVAQVMNNLAYSLAQSGDLRRALRLSRELVNEQGDYIHHASDYQRALFYNTNALIHIRSARYLHAEEPLAHAEQAALNSQRKRAIGLVAWARAQLETAKMRPTRTPNDAIDEHYQRAAEMLRNEPDMLRELYYSWSAYQREVGLLYRRASVPNLPQADQYEERALAYLDQALDLLPPGPSMQRANFFESKSTIYNIRGDYTNARAMIDAAEEIMITIPTPEYGQLIGGRLALQHADIALHETADYQSALRWMAVGLARAYVFAPQHRDQETFEHLIERFLDEVPQPELEQFVEDLDSGALTLAAADLLYARPDAAAWRTAWRSSTDFVADSIATQLGI
jgi:tetratricopeptide (TPR) repeat protein